MAVDKEGEKQALKALADLLRQVRCARRSPSAALLPRSLRSCWRAASPHPPPLPLPLRCTACAALHRRTTNTPASQLYEMEAMLGDFSTPASQELLLARM